MNFNNTILLNLNVNGLKNKINILLALLIHHNVDIACVGETHLAYTDKIKFSGYRIYREARVTHLRVMGGVAIIVRNKIKQK